ncbi:MAG: class I SAM-dependent methyltransferase [Myxococcales bacterium]|nr:class I SAM-dependent methyltransferase [Myxococcales bacterium]
MSHQDRERWNARYRAGSHVARAPSELLRECATLLPSRGHALDVAGGAGHNALWLAARGLESTLVDISDVALEFARERARAGGLTLRALELDLERAPLPASAAPSGRYSLIVCLHYLQRALFPAMIEALAPGGLLLFAQPTVTNLERNTRPSRRFLIEREELRELAGLSRGLLEVVRYEEAWTERGTHEAQLLARRPTAPSS